MMFDANEASSQRSLSVRSGHRHCPAPRVRAFLVAALVATGCSSLEHAPGPEDPALAGATRGTLLVTESTGFVHHSIALVDLPTRRTLELRVPTGWAVLGGLDDAGRIAYLVPRHTAGWELRVLDVTSGEGEKLLDLERNPWRLRLAPTGGTLVLWKDAGVAVEIVDLESRARREVEPSVGDVAEVYWLPDGAAFAVNGTDSGAIVDVASAVVCERSASYGPFSPDGETFLAARDGTWQLIERASGRALAAPAQLPWPYQDGGARELALPPVHGLCGPHLALYSALPTEGMPTRHVFGAGSLERTESGVLKVSDLVSGAYATLRFHDVWRERLLYSPERLAVLAGDAGAGTR
jgi:hypothetical protein